MSRKALRADARDNRDRIVEFARSAWANDAATSMNAIAKAADVGAGTLYRHFPSRESLVLAVYQRELENLVALVPSLLARHSSIQAFRMWCDRFVKFGRVKYGVADIVHAATSEQHLQDTYQPLVGAVRSLMEACEADGSIVRELTPEDFLLMIGLLWRLPPGMASTAQTNRIVSFIFRGLQETQARTSS